MQTLKKYPLIAALLAINLIVVAFLIQRNLVQQQQASRKAAKATIEAATRMDKAKFIRKDDYLKLTSLGKEMKDTGRISDEDLEWCLNLLKSNPAPDISSGKVPMQLMVTTRLLWYVKEYTPHQKDVLLAFSSEALKGNGGLEGNEYLIAFNFMKKTQDKRIVPFVLPYLENTNKRIQQAATNTLVAVGASSEIAGTPK